jgi:hypothetical protein
MSIIGDPVESSQAMASAELRKRDANRSTISGVQASVQVRQLQQLKQASASRR